MRLVATPFDKGRSTSSYIISQGWQYNMSLLSAVSHPRSLWTSPLHSRQALWMSPELLFKVENENNAHFCVVLEVRADVGSSPGSHWVSAGKKTPGWVKPDQNSRDSVGSRWTQSFSQLDFYIEA